MNTKPSEKKTRPKNTVRKKRLSRSKLKKVEIEALFFRLREARPEPQSELNYSNPYTLVVAVALSAQATDTGVNKATRALFEKITTPAQMVSLGEAKLIEYIRTIGLFRTKAKNIIALSRMLLDDFGGEVPTDREQLEKLPGVGRKTASVVANVAFGEPTIAVDTHIFRVSNRTGLGPGKTPNAVEEILERIVPDLYKLHAHHWLILHGRYICKARKPGCPNCSIFDLCKFNKKTLET
ncbi:MAG: endonuclease III [bacterium]|nr:endonuclease III [bacterium]